MNETIIPITIRLRVEIEPVIMRPADTPTAPSTSGAGGLVCGKCGRVFDSAQGLRVHTARSHKR